MLLARIPIIFHVQPRTCHGWISSQIFISNYVTRIHVNTWWTLWRQHMKHIFLGSCSSHWCAVSFDTERETRAHDDEVTKSMGVASLFTGEQTCRTPVLWKALNIFGREGRITDIEVKVQTVVSFWLRGWVLNFVRSVTCTEDVIKFMINIATLLLCFCVAEEGGVVSTGLSTEMPLLPAVV